MEAKKVLFYGHSWINYFEKYASSYSQEIRDRYEFQSLPGSSFEDLSENIGNILTNGHSHVILFGLMLEMFEQEYILKSGNNKRYPVIVPRKRFNIIELIDKIRLFIRKCHNLFPDCRVIVFVEPLLRVDMWNNLKVGEYPLCIQERFKMDYKFASRRSMEERQLKIIAALQDSIVKDVLFFFNYENLDQPYFDGIHPNHFGVQKIWQAFKHHQWSDTLNSRDQFYDKMMNVICSSNEFHFMQNAAKHSIELIPEPMTDIVPVPEHPIESKAANETQMETDQPKPKETTDENDKPTETVAQKKSFYQYQIAVTIERISAKEKLQGNQVTLKQIQNYIFEFISEGKVKRLNLGGENEEETAITADNSEKDK